MSEELVLIIIIGYPIAAALGALLDKLNADAGYALIFVGTLCTVLSLVTLISVFVEAQLDEPAKTAATQVQPKQAEPYGGCDEATRYPNTEGWEWCRDRGLLD